LKPAGKLDLQTAMDRSPLRERSGPIEARLASVAAL
jgi:hypothetical protein